MSNPSLPRRSCMGALRFTLSRLFRDVRASAQGLPLDDGVVKLVLYKGKPVTYQGQLLYEHEYSDHLMIKLLEAGDPDQFNRQRVAPFDAESLNLSGVGIGTGG
jgi:hypothetical protein